MHSVAALLEPIPGEEIPVRLFFDIERDTIWGAEPVLRGVECPSCGKWMGGAIRDWAAGWLAANANDAVAGG